VYAAYKAATELKDAPTVILAKTVKGWALGPEFEARNATHQIKKMTEEELRRFAERIKIEISSRKLSGEEPPFYHPGEDSDEVQYIKAQRRVLGGFVPRRRAKPKPISLPSPRVYEGFDSGTVDRGQEVSTTMAFVRLLRDLMRDREIGSRVVPIIPDEARTFGMESMFKDFKIYSPRGQLYEPVDASMLLSYTEGRDGQILEEGITEAGSMASFTAAGTAYATHGRHMLPFFLFYSMFGFQRIGDLIWAAADMKTRGFLLGATAGRTTLNGEGLQHEDGHSLILASTIPTLLTYDPAFAYEVAVIIADGMRRMFVNGEDVFYYLTLYNENQTMPAMPAGVEEGILKGLYRFKAGVEGKKLKAHILGSGPIITQALRAQQILAERYGVSADVWSATNYKELRNDALSCQRWNMLHPTQPARKSYVEKLLEKEQGAFVAVSDYMRIVPDQIAPWVPGGLMTLGTDGFGRSETRANLRRFFEVDAESTVIATLYALAEKGKLEKTVVAQAIKDLDVNPEKVFPQLA